MDIITFLMQYVQYFVHLDEYLAAAISTYGTLIYGILFMIIFMETGFVITPFLPGDSLLFAAGTFAAIGSLNVLAIFLLLSSAAVIGDNTNYWIGRFLGPKVFKKKKSLLFNKKYLDETKAFYRKHGGKTTMLARYFPIIRTFAPFVAGVGKMDYGRFLLFDILGGLTWVGLFVFSGYFFGNIPIVKENFEFVIMGIILISIIPLIMKMIKKK